MCGMLIVCETSSFDLDVCHAEGNMWAVGHKEDKINK